LFRGEREREERERDREEREETSDPLSSLEPSLVERRRAKWFTSVALITISVALTRCLRRLTCRICPRETMMTINLRTVREYEISFSISSLSLFLVLSCCFCSL
jgi:hypothetical protein